MDRTFHAKLKAMKHHVGMICSLVALGMILGTALLLVMNKSHDTSLIVVLATGAVTIGQAIAGIKATGTNPPPNQPAAEPQKEQ